MCGEDFNSPVTAYTTNPFTPSFMLAMPYIYRDNSSFSLCAPHFEKI